MSNTTVPFILSLRDANKKTISFLAYNVEDINDYQMYSIITEFSLYPSPLDNLRRLVTIVRFMDKLYNDYILLQICTLMDGNSSIKNFCITGCTDNSKIGHSVEQMDFSLMKSIVTAETHKFNSLKNK